MSQLTNIKCHVEMMATDRMKKHAMTGPEGDHDLPFQVFRYLSGYDEALGEIGTLNAKVDLEGKLKRLATKLLMKKTRELKVAKARIDELEILNEELTDLYNKHMRSWAERETAQDSLLDEGKALIVRLIQYIRNPDKKRMNTAMLINYSTMMEEADSLIDRICSWKNGGN